MRSTGSRAPGAGSAGAAPPFALAGLRRTLPSVASAKEGAPFLLSLVLPVVGFTFSPLPACAQGDAAPPEEVGQQAQEGEEGAKEAAEEFVDWGDEEEPVPPPAPAKHEIAFEFRESDIFEQPFGGFGPQSLLMPLPDRLFECSYSLRATHVDFFKVEHEYYWYEAPEFGDAFPNSGYVMLFWERTLSTGANLDLDYGHLWNEEGKSGFWFAGAVGWSPVFNLDCYARVEGTRSFENASGVSLSGKIRAAIDGKTALQARAYLFAGEDGASALQGQLGLARYLAARTGLHLLLRGSAGKDDEGNEPEWKVGAVELRHRLPSGTLFRISYRYFDGWQPDVTGMTKVTATGFSVGAEQILSRGSFGALYRRHGASEDYLDERLVEETWRFFVKLWF